MANRRELYRSPNGDSWFIGRDPSDGRLIVIHEPNRPSGAHTACIELSVFLASDSGSPERQALLRLMGTLVDVPSYATDP